MKASLACILGLLLVTACDKADGEDDGSGSGDGSTDSTDDPSGGGSDGPDDGSGDCTEETTVLGSLDEATPLGFTAQDVLDNIGGEYAETLGWLPPEGPASYAMGGTEVGMTLNVSHGAGELRYIEATATGFCDGACGEFCVDRIEIDGKVAFATEDGVLDESWSTTLTASQVDRARFYHPFDPDETSGTMTLASWTIDADVLFRTLIASGTVGNGETTGELGVEIEGPGPGGGWIGFGVAGAWPPWE